jgi:hypothetical protein
VAIGDVYELATPCGYAYLQRTHEHPDYKSLIRVLDGLFPEPQQDLEDLVAAPERFFVFFLVGAAVRDRFVRRIGNFRVPEHARPFPEMRIELLTGGSVIVANATDELGKVATLTPEQERMPRVEIWPQPVLLSRVASDWSWVNDAHQQEAGPASPCYDIEVAWPRLEDDTHGADAGTGEHYVYFPTHDAAVEAKRRVGVLAARVIVQRAADSEHGWLLTAVEDSDQDELEDVLVAAAEDLGGEYDGTERRLDAEG